MHVKLPCNLTRFIERHDELRGLARKMEFHWRLMKSLGSGPNAMRKGNIFNEVICVFSQLK